MNVLNKYKTVTEPELISGLYKQIDQLETIIRDDNRMKRELLDIFQQNNYNNKDLIIRKIKSILDRYMNPEREVNNAN